MTHNPDALISSTRNALSGDFRLSLGEKLRYFVNCARDNLSARHASGTRVDEYDLPLLPLEALKNQITGSPAPSRLNSISFWQSLPWPQIASELGEIRVLEIGCGKSGLISLLAEKLGASLTRYTGIDIESHESWNDLIKQDSRVSYLQSAAEELPDEVLRNANMIISNSALEHVRGDLAFFQSHRRSMDMGKPVIQIHMVPAAITLALYLLHGYRQYTRSTVSRIAAIYPESRCSLVPLGGMLSTFLHFAAITTPTAIRLSSISRRPHNVYITMLKASYNRERTGRPRFPSTYGIFLESGLARPILASDTIGN